MTEYIFIQTIVQFRVPIKDDGTLGSPEVIKKFTTEMNQSQKKYTRKKDTEVTQKQKEAAQLKLQTQQKKLEQVKEKEQEQEKKGMLKELFKTDIQEVRYQ